MRQNVIELIAFPDNELRTLAYTLKDLITHKKQ